MGRRPTVNLSLPPRMRVKHNKKGKSHFYYDYGGKPRRWEPLGSNYIEALKKYVELEDCKQPLNEFRTFKDAWDRYQLEVLPAKAPRTQRDNLTEIENLLSFFCDPRPAPLDHIESSHITQYFAWRKAAPVRANREIALFSHIFNMARAWGMTNTANPVAGLKRNKETGRRDVYIEDDVYDKVRNAACEPLRLAIDLAYETGQRPGDVLRYTVYDLVDVDSREYKGKALNTFQSKTSARLRVAIVGGLKEVIERILEYRKSLDPTSTRLIVDEQGKSIEVSQLWYRLRKAKTKAGVPTQAFQFRDIRAKAGTDKEEMQGMEAAQAQLGHTSQEMTRTYIRHRKGKLVAPTSAPLK